MKKRIRKILNLLIFILILLFLGFFINRCCALNSSSITKEELISEIYATKNDKEFIYFEREDMISFYFDDRIYLIIEYTIDDNILTLSSSSQDYYFNIINLNLLYSSMLNSYFTKKGS